MDAKKLEAEAKRWVEAAKETVLARHWSEVIREAAHNKERAAKERNDPPHVDLSQEVLHRHD